MKSFQRLKEINGKEYLYEITPYYDSKTKTIRQKSRYLGRMKNGKLTKPDKPLPKLVLSYGDFLPLKKIANELGVSSLLEGVCKKADADTIQCLAFNRILRPLALQNIARWTEGTILSEKELALSSQTLSSFMQRLGNSSIPAYFIERFVRQHNKADSVAYDITSLSSYSVLNNLLEYGYNRKGDGLPQFNLSLAVDRERGIPLLYDIYPGSINDVSTVRNSITKLSEMGVSVSVFVFDRGFFSAANIDELIEKKMPFIIGAPFSLKEVRMAVSKLHADLEDPNQMRMYEKKPIFVKQIAIPVGVHTLQGFLYFDIKREQEEKTTFYVRLNAVKSRLEKTTIRSWMDPQRLFEDIAKDLRQYLSYKVQGDGFLVEIRNNAVAQRINRMGKTVLLFNGDFDWKECLQYYREKDVVEKHFRMLKGSILQSPPNTQSAEAMRGWIFILYLALMVRFRLQRQMKETRLDEQYSVETLLMELEKIKKVKMTNGVMLTTEITKTQKEIMDKLGLCA